MVELTILYEGTALAGKRESIVELAKHFPSAAFEVLVPQEYAQVPVLVVKGERVSLRVTTRSGALASADIDRHLRDTADGIVFVIDSQRERWEGNEERRDLLAPLIDARRLPIVWQANRRDAPNRLPVRELSKLDRWNAPMFESIAKRGIGVWEPFEAIARLVGQRRQLDADVRGLLAQRRA